MSRISMELAASAGAAGGDTGFLWGELQQLRYVPDAEDTGQVGTISLSVLPNENDTGDGWTVWAEAAANLGAKLGPRYLRVPSHDTGGAVVAGSPVPVYAEGDRLRAKVTPADTGNVIAGKLYVWTKENAK